MMIECLKLVSFALPQVAASAMDIARRYWIDGSVPLSDLETLRVQCWEYLNERSASTNTIAPEFCAIRAVICVLYASSQPHDVGDRVYFFNEMMRGALKHEDDRTFFEKMISIVDKFSKK
jgi:hypothetical protein